MAGELGLEPRMTVPKTVVLPLHHSPAGPAFPKHSVRRRRSDTPSRFGMQHPLSALRGEAARPAPTVGVWLSLVEHCVRDAGVGGSNPLTPTIFFPTSTFLTAQLRAPSWPQVILSDAQLSNRLEYLKGSSSRTTWRSAGLFQASFPSSIPCKWAVAV